MKPGPYRSLAALASFGWIALCSCAPYGASSPDAAQFERLRALDANAPVAALNLLQIQPRARYAPGDPEFGTEAADVSGDEALDRYLAVVGPMVEALGGRVVFDTAVEQVVIGPNDPEWNRAVLLYFPTRQAFLAMAADEEFRAARRHRKAAQASTLMLHLDGAPFAE